MKLTVEEIIRDEHTVKGVLTADGVDLFGFIDYGYPKYDLELECTHPTGLELCLSDLIDAFSKQIPSLSTIDVDKSDPITDASGVYRPGMMVTLSPSDEKIYVSIIWKHQGRPYAELSIPFAQSVDEDEFRRRSERILLRHGMELIDVEEHNDFSYHTWSVTAAFLEDLPLRDAYRCVEPLTLAAHSAVWPDQPSADEVLRIIHLGHIELLSGWLIENDWFDAKERVDLTDTQGRLEFAKDLAQFANGPTGGILLIGAKTKKDEGGIETFAKLAPLNKNPQVTQPVSRIAQTLRSLAASHIYPAIQGLRIEIVSSDKGQVIYAHVPNQADRMKPFIVMGESISGEIKMNFFTIPVRINDGNVPVTAYEIHSLLAGKMIRWRGTDSR
ncbi:hypothetical protein [Streptomyces sp. NPDC060243]|uniref:hypothetical protein n=1 Tax=Streptomyces sp. NPDC060243 TaxID=3347081 RepID=UPI003649543E